MSNKLDELLKKIEQRLPQNPEEDKQAVSATEQI